ncbi:NADPH-dependent FMN reductase [Pseudoruegeria sp. HB172150]|uniref:NADPH-dependent FMN reductase n=1 Tax=Pseudoruegeria sp. HB172150 TaxID=2721164 RepID=UPI001553A12A|nr:NAD(P)H-dependent oxidoreductase [Pseudoruegeria sp. HB172150]
MPAQLDIALIQGSIRDGRFNDTVTEWTDRELRKRGLATHVIDPQTPALLPVQTGEAHAVETLRWQLEGMDGFVIVTPEYNHAAPGPLKTLIDAAKPEWAARPVGFVSYGGLSGGLRAVESLRPVFAELHAVTIRETVSFSSPWKKFGPGSTLIEDDVAVTAETAMDAFAACLTWWARALRSARAENPYEQRAA